MHKFLAFKLSSPTKPLVHFLLRLDHLVLDQAQYLNPLVGSNYNDEDMMGKIKVLAKLSTPTRLGFQVLERYSAYVCCRWLRE